MRGSDTVRGLASDRGRSILKSALAAGPVGRDASGASLLIYHRVGGGTRNELDCPTREFERQLDILDAYDVVSLDGALDRLEAHDARPSVVLTFDDGFDDVYRLAWPMLRERRLPFTIYLATAYMERPMVWEGATATGERGRGMAWRHLEELLASGLVTIGNHTHDHVRPQDLDVRQLDRCTETISARLGISPRHFTYPWGVPVPAMEEDLRARFRSASTGELGRNLPGADPMRLRRIPVRRTDPPRFFARKLSGSLRPERAYARVVQLAKDARLPR